MSKEVLPFFTKQMFNELLNQWINKQIIKFIEELRNSWINKRKEKLFNVLMIVNVWSTKNNQ